MNWIRSFLLPADGSSYAREHDGLFVFIVLLSVVFFTLITGLAGWFVWRYRRSRSLGPTPHITHNTQLEIVWSVIPLLILTSIFFWGFNSYMSATTSHGDALEIQVQGKKWLWTFEYPDGTRTVNEIHVPAGKPVKLVMSSEDVIHSFFLPEFRVKQDVLPNRYTELSFTPEKEGLFTAFCAEYCGRSHSDMMAKVWVDSDAKFQKWREEGDETTRTMPLAQLGAMLFESRGCNTCHSIDGTRGQGPTFKGIFGNRAHLASGQNASVDENYLRESMLDPQAKVVAGFEPIMPTFQGLLREREIKALVEFIKEQK